MSSVPAIPALQPAVPPSEDRNNFHRLLIGGLGALTPILAQLLLVDLESVFSHVSVYAGLGYFVRAGLLFGVGVLAVFLDASEFNKARLFQIGMSAPALLLATLNGAQLAHAPVSPPPVGIVEISPLVVTVPAPATVDAGTPVDVEMAKLRQEVALLTALQQRLLEQKAAAASSSSPTPASAASAPPPSGLEEMLRGAVGAKK